MQQTNLNEDFIEEFTKLIQIDKQDFNIKQILSNYANWDSLAVVSMIAIIDQYFGVKVRGQEIENCCTLEDIFLKVKEKQN